MVEVRRIDFGKQIAGFDRRADVGLPILQIAAHPRIDLRLIISLEPTRKVEAAALASHIGGGDRDNRHGLLFGPFAQFGVGNAARRQAHDDDDGRHRPRQDGEGVETASRHDALGGVRRHVALQSPGSFCGGGRA